MEEITDIVETSSVPGVNYKNLALIGVAAIAGYFSGRAVVKFLSKNQSAVSDVVETTTNN